MTAGVNDLIFVVLVLFYVHFYICKRETSDVRKKPKKEKKCTFSLSALPVIKTFLF